VSFGLHAGKAGKYAGGNSVCVRPKPEWQKGISTFLKKLPEKENETGETGSKKAVDECVIVETTEAGYVVICLFA
jgi:hypothetical protein